MICKTKLKQLAKFTEADTPEAQSVKTLNDALLEMFKKPQDKYLQAALKSTGFKGPKKAPEDLLGGLGLSAQMAQVIRNSTLLRSLETAPLTYPVVEGFYNWSIGPLPYPRYYAIPDKAHKKGDLNGRLGVLHQPMVVDEFLKMAQKYKTFHGRCVSLQDAAGKLKLRDHEIDNNTNSLQKITLEGLAEFGITIEEQNQSVQSADSALNTLMNIAQSNNDFMLNKAELEGLERFITSLNTDLERIQIYMHDFGQVKAISSAAKTAQMTLFSEDKPSFTAHIKSLCTEEITLSDKIQNLKELADKKGEDRSFDIETGRYFGQVKFPEAVERKVRNYIDDKIAYLEDPRLEIDQINAFDAQPQAREVLKLMSRARQAEATINFFKEPYLRVGEDAMVKNLDVHAKLDEITTMADVISLEVEHALLCALKNTDQFGPKSILANFIAATARPSIDRHECSAESENEQDNEQEKSAPLLGQQGSALEQMILILSTDLRSHGWDGQWPKSAQGKIPDLAALMRYQKQGFDAYLPKYYDALPLAEAETIIQKDIEHRQTALARLSGYLNQSKRFLSPRRQIEVDDALAFIEQDLQPCLKNLAEESAINMPLEPASEIDPALVSAKHPRFNVYRM
tara:strand:+ start:386572 stop:388452 length:1881 start_codon:yes stop_codon:yes gene_type:complete